jgi:Tol biopolymer transport system component/DNA-binding winged helix-turn-helix (wHTH) protein
VGATQSSSNRDRIFRFGPFELSEAAAELRKNGVRIKLQDQPFRVLVELLANAGKVVSREELQQRLWPADTFVDFDVGLNTAIRKLRQALSDDADHPRYIETLAKRGYRFLAPTLMVPAATEAVSGQTSQPGAPPAFTPVPESRSLANSEQPSEASGVAVAVEPTPAVQRDSKAEPAKKWKWIAIGAIVAALIAGIVFWWTRPPAAPVVESITQLTDDQKAKFNLQTDGARIYFNEGQGGSLQIAQVAVKGGPVAPIPTSIPTPAIAAGGIAPDGLSFLILQGPTPVPRPLWEMPLPTGEPRRLGNLDPHEASFTPDGRLLLSRVTDLFLVDRDGSNPRKILTLGEGQGHFGDAAMSPDGRRIVFTHYGAPELYIVNSDGSGMKLLAKSSEGGFCCARWTPDGRYIVFATRAPNTRQDLWYMRMQSGWLQRSSEPKRLTAGPLSYWNPAPGRDGKTIFATGVNRKTAWFRYDLASHTFAPFSIGANESAAPTQAGWPGYNITFSADGQWVAYVSQADNALWRSRSDGSDRLQLTVPSDPANPFISPDGKWVVYNGRDFRTFIVSTDGGTPRRLDNLLGGGANWSPDGRFLVYNEGKNSWQTPEVKVFDLRTGQVSTIPGGQMNPVWAAPGKICAVTRDYKVLQLYDVATQKWSDLTNPEDGPVAGCTHSPDFQYLYYSTRGQNPRIMRIHMDDMKSEVVASLKDVHLGAGILDAYQMSVAPDGSPILLYAIGTQEIYALTVKWP